MDEKFRKAYRESIRRVLVQMVSSLGFLELGRAVGFLRLMDDVFDYVDAHRSPDRNWLDVETAGQLLWFIGSQLLYFTDHPDSFVAVKELYERYLRWVGPKKFTRVDKKQFIDTLAEMFGWTVAKKNGRLCFFGVHLKE